MSARGREVFDEYIAHYLNQPALAGLSMESRAHNLLSNARAAGIAAPEIIEEVDPLVRASADARSKGRHG